MSNKSAEEWATQNLKADERTVIGAILNYWGENVTNLKIVEEDVGRGGLFIIHFRLYDRVDVQAGYERSLVGFDVKINGKYTSLDKLIKGVIIDFDKFRSPEVMKHNFSLLDMVVRKM